MTPVVVGHIDASGKNHPMPLGKSNAISRWYFSMKVNMSDASAPARGPIADAPRIGGRSERSIGHIAFGRDVAVVIMDQLAAAADHCEVLPDVRHELRRCRRAQPAGAVSGNEIEAIRPVRRPAPARCRDEFRPKSSLWLENRLA